MKKGFTILEVLGVVIILALLFAISVPMVSKVIYDSKVNLYKKNEQVLVKAADLFALKNQSYYPNEIGESKEIRLRTLQEHKYISSIVNPQDSEQECRGYVLITKIAPTEYDFTPHLKCGVNINTVEEDGLLLHYTLNDSIVDFSTNNKTGIFTGETPEFKENYKNQKSLYFQNSRLHSYDLLNDIDNNTITLSAFINREESINEYNMFLGQLLPYFSFRSNNTFLLSMNINGSQNSLVTTKTFSNNIWYHVVGVYDGTYMKIYVNGRLEAEKTAGGIMSKFPTYLFSIGDGRNIAWYPFKGSIREVRVYKRALNDQEVLNMYDLLK